MNILIVLIPASLLLAIVSLAAFIWTIRHKQYDDLSGDAARIIMSDDD